MFWQDNSLSFDEFYNQVVQKIFDVVYDVQAYKKRCPEKVTPELENKVARGIYELIAAEYHVHSASNFLSDLDFGEDDENESEIDENGADKNN